MRLWRTVLLLLVVALVAALGWHWLASDPGYVQVRMHGTVIETSLVVAVAAALLAWAVLGIGWALLRWPFRAWGRSVKRRGRERLAAGLTAFAEGDYVQAERDLARAAAHEAFRTPALLVSARAAYERGVPDRAAQALDAVGAAGARAADATRARFLVESGRHVEALELLKPKAGSGDLPPRSWRLLAEAALASGDTQAALDALAPLARSQSLATDTQTALETRVLAAALGAAADVPRLNALWSAATRAQRRRPELVAAFARRSAALGQVLAAMDEIESAQRREWSDALAIAYGDLGVAEAGARLHKAEAWLSLAPNSAPLLTTLGRLYLLDAQPGRAEEALERALALSASARTWETLGDCRTAENDAAGACIAYANALRCARGDATVPLAPLLARAALDTRPVAFEERSEHG